MRSTNTFNYFCFIFNLVIFCIFFILLFFKFNFIENIVRYLNFKTLRPYSTAIYQETLLFQLRVDGNVPKNSILFFGDSITQGLCISAVSCNGINFGIGGDDSYSLSKRIIRYTSIKDSLAIVIAIGINDILQNSTIEEILNNYSSLFSVIPSHIPIFLTALLPVDESIIPKSLNTLISTLNSKSADLCALKFNCFFVNLNHNLVDFNGNLDYQYHIGDGLHLNKVGYNIMINQLKEVLDYNIYINQR
jgi:lysophospholipase L1-like esterase